MNTLPIERDTTEAWKQLTTEGNLLFDAGSLHAALERYEHARRLVLATFSEWTDTDDVVAAVVVSFLNLSEAQARLGLVNLAAQSLCTVHGSLLRTRGDASLRPELRQAAHRHVQDTRSALVRFQLRYGGQPLVERWLSVDEGGCCANACGCTGTVGAATLH